MEGNISTTVWLFSQCRKQYSSKALYPKTILRKFKSLNHSLYAEPKLQGFLTFRVTLGQALGIVGAEPTDDNLWF